MPRSAVLVLVSTLAACPAPTTPAAAPEVDPDVHDSAPTTIEDTSTSDACTPPTLLDGVPPGSLATWTIVQDPENPEVVFTETRSAFDGSTALGIDVVGTTASACTTDFASKVFTLPAFDPSGAGVEFELACEVSGGVNDTVWIGLVLRGPRGTRTVEAALAGCDGGYRTEELRLGRPERGRVRSFRLGLDTAAAAIGAVETIEVRLMGYACVGVGSGQLDQLTFVPPDACPDTTGTSP